MYFYGSFASPSPRDARRSLGRDPASQGHGKRRFRWPGIFAAGLLLFVILVVVTRSNRKTSSEKPSFATFPSSKKGRGGDQTELSFIACNDYTCNKAPVTYPYPWLEDVQLVEPFRDTVLAVVNPRIAHKYHWTITDRRGSSTTLDGATLTHQFTELEQHKITLVETHQTVHDRTVQRTHTEVVMCKYVRREIRSLSDADRDDFVAALHTLWAVGPEEGRALYGEDYVGIAEFVKLHHIATAQNISCDSFYYGLGFPINHVLMGNALELSMQLVNSKVSLPYWDYTIESHIINYELDGLFTKMKEATPIFQPDWFGAGDDTERIVKDGMWAWSKIPELTEVERAAGTVTNVFGLVRAPWFTDGRPYLERGMGNACGDFMELGEPWPSCEDHYELLQLNTYYDFAYNSYFDASAHAGFWVSGWNDCEPVHDAIAALVGAKAAFAFRMFAGLNRKLLWSAGYWACAPGRIAPAGTTQEEIMRDFCGCAQAGMDVQNIDDLLAILLTIRGYDDIKDFDIDIQRQVADMVCHDTVSTGQYEESAAPLDPAYWPMFPTLERLLQLKLLTKSLDMFWTSVDYTVTVENGTTADTIEYEVSSFGDSCIGHRPDDVWPYGLVEDDFKVSMFGEKNINKLTNLEATLALDPNVNVLPYIYDSFSWPLCEEEGFDMFAFFGKNGTFRPPYLSARRPEPARRGRRAY